MKKEAIKSKSDKLNKLINKKIININVKNYKLKNIKNINFE